MMAAKIAHEWIIDFQSSEGGDMLGLVLAIRKWNDHGTVYIVDVWVTVICLYV